MSQQQFAEKVQIIHRSYIGAIESGARNPTWTVLCAISRALDAPLRVVTDRAEEMEVAIQRQAGDPPPTGQTRLLPPHALKRT